MICSTISKCHGHESPFGPAPDYNVGFSSFVTLDAETSTSEEPGARKGHAGICAGAVWVTGRSTAMPYRVGPRDSWEEVAHGISIQEERAKSAWSGEEEWRSVLA